MKKLKKAKRYIQTIIQKMIGLRKDIKTFILIQVRGYRKTDTGKDDASTARGTIMGLEYIFENSEYPGERKLSLQGHDATLLTTMTKGEWFLNPNGIEN